MSSINSCVAPDELGDCVVEDVFPIEDDSIAVVVEILPETDLPIPSLIVDLNTLLCPWPSAASTSTILNLGCCSCCSDLAPPTVLGPDCNLLLPNPFPPSTSITLNHLPFPSLLFSPDCDGDDDDDEGVETTSPLSLIRRSAKVLRSRSRDSSVSVVD